MTDEDIADDLRMRLSRLDPASHHLDPTRSHPAPELLESVMTTPLLDESPTAPAPRRTSWLAAAAAALVVAGGAISFAVSQDDPAVHTSIGPLTRLELTLPPSGVMASCVPFDVTFLKDMSPAFAGTVTEVGAASVTLDVDKWYAGGTADQVTIAQPDGNSSAALDGVAFEKGKRYLVTAANGTVNGCGYSGLATPDFEKSFDEAFPSSG